MEGTDYSFGKKVTITCKSGFILMSGDKERTCQADGQWSGKAGTCAGKYCGFVSQVFSEIAKIRYLVHYFNHSTTTCAYLRSQAFSMHVAFYCI